MTEYKIETKTSMSISTLAIIINKNLNTSYSQSHKRQVWISMEKQQVSYEKL
jgi:hypothetical protein